MEQGKIIGPRPPLRPGHGWSVRAKLHLELSVRDLALFNLAIDSKLRGCDLVALRVDDVAPHGYAIDRANVRQRKTGRPVRFELTEQTGSRSTRICAAAVGSRGRFCFGPGRPRSISDDAAVRAPGGAVGFQRQLIDLACQRNILFTYDGKEYGPLLKTPAPSWSARGAGPTRKAHRPPFPSSTIRKDTLTSG
jgi:hypothetical protein